MGDYERKNVDLQEIDSKEYDLYYDEAYDINLSFDEKEEFKTQLESELKDLLDEHNPIIEEEVQKNLNQYYGIVEDDYDDSTERSNISLPLTKETVDGFVVRARKAIIQVYPRYEVEPLDEKAVPKKSKIEKCLDYTTKIEISYDSVIDKALFDASLHGTGITLTYWKIKEREVIDLFSYKGSSGKKELLKKYDESQVSKSYLKKLDSGEEIVLREKYIKKIKDGPEVEYVPLEDFICNNEIEDIEDQHLHGKRQAITGSDLIERFKNSNSTLIDRIYNDYQGSENTEFEDTKRDFLKDDFLLYYLVYHYPIDGLNNEEKKVIVEILYDPDKLSEIYILNLKRYPYNLDESCFTKWAGINYGSNFHKPGFAEILRNPQVAADTVFNLAIDAATYKALPVMAASEAEKATLEPQIYDGIYPLKTFYLQDPSQFQPLRIGAENLSYVFPLLNMIQTIPAASTGVIKEMLGRIGESDKNAPASRTAMLLKEANLKVSTMIKTLQTSNSKIAFLIIDLYKRFMIQGRTFATKDSRGSLSFIKINKDDLDANVYYHVIGTADDLEKERSEQVFLQQLPLLAQNPLLNPRLNPQGFRELTETQLKTIGRLTDHKLDKILPSPEELKEHQAKMMARALEIKEQKQQQKQQITQRAQQRTQELMESGVSAGAAKKQVSQELGTGDQGGNE